MSSISIILKRNGQQKPFESERISIAIEKAFLSENIINILNNISKVLFSISMAGIGLTVAFKDLKVSALKISFAVLSSSLLMIGFAIIGIVLFRL